MRHFLLGVALGTVVITAAAIAHAQSAGNPTADRSDDIVVTAERTEQIARQFVGDVSAAPARRDQLARWDAKVCPGVAGMNAEQGQFLVDMISRRAYAVGLRPGASGCKANLLIVVTPDADGVAQAVAREARGLLGVRDRPENMATRGVDALDAFTSSTAPVRWWHVSQMTTVDGVIVPEPPGCGSAATGMHCLPRPVPVRGVHTSASTREDFRNALVIVDATKLSGVHLQALADYIAMVSLAQLEPGSDTSAYDSILNLFTPAAGRATPVSLTDWDAAYLDGLYHSRRNPYHARSQEADISHRMAHDLTPSEGAVGNQS